MFSVVLRLAVAVAEPFGGADPIHRRHAGEPTQPIQLQRRSLNVSHALYNVRPIPPVRFDGMCGLITSRSGEQ